MSYAEFVSADQCKNMKFWIEDLQPSGYELICQIGNNKNPDPTTSIAENC